MYEVISHFRCKIKGSKETFLKSAQGRPCISADMEMKLGMHKLYLTNLPSLLKKSLGIYVHIYFSHSYSIIVRPDYSKISI